MKKVRLVLAWAGLFLISTTVRAQFADAVLSYDPGTGFAPGYTNATSALGAPALGSSVNPMSPPYLKSQLVSIGAGGEIALHLDTPITDNPSDPYGLDFIIFANSFFVANGGSGQNTTTSGSLYYHPASILIQVSADNINWFTLNPSLAPQPGKWFPSYGGGNPEIPVNPVLAATGFAGMTLGQIESLYDGSAGGTGYDLAWAQDAKGNSVELASADYVRIEVQDGVLDMDAISVVPEPAAWALVLVGVGLLWFRLRKKSPSYCLVAGKFLILSLGLVAVSTGKATTLTENFSTDPLQNGWRIFGNTNLFRWDAARQNLEVTWDSSSPNSYFYKPLGTVLARDDDFQVEFDLTLTDATAVGYMELAVGLLNFAQATNAAFSRPAGNTPNLFEFDYFPGGPESYGPSLDVSLADDTVSATNESDFYFAYDTNALLNGVTYHVILTHTNGQAGIAGEILTNGQIFTTFPNVYAGPISDFRLDTLSISSYSTNGDPYGDSILAHGVVDNITVTLPPPPIRNFSGVWSNGFWQAQWISRSNWLYTLQRATDLGNWTDVSASVPGNATNLWVTDTNPPPGHAFYRVKAERP